MTTPTDPLYLSDRDLLQQCQVDTFRASGPGGQKRNKTDSAVRLRHQPTGLTAQAVESRSQHDNRARALSRLRQEIALHIRRPVDVDAYRVPAALAAILPTARNRIGPRHQDFWPGVRDLLDLFVATRCSVGETAALLGLNTGALSRVITSEPHLLERVNQLRAGLGLHPLRP